MAEVDTILVKDANGNIREVPTLLSLEQMVASQATVAAILAKLSADPASQTTLAAILAKIIAAPATEAKQDTLIAKDFATQTTLAAVLAKLSADPASQTTLAAILAKLIAAPSTEAKQDALAALTGALTETAPATDIASSGLNGRLQRIAQRITSLIALVPASLGSKADAASLAVTKSTEDKALTGALTETAPASDIASSGLNGRLQRIAQRLTSLIGLLPTALGQGTMAASLKVAIASDQSAIPVGHNTSGLGHGVKAVTAAGTAEAIAASTAAKWVIVQAQTDNTGIIAVGGSGVLATVATGTGVALVAGALITIPCDNLADIFVDATVSGDGVRFTYGT